MANLLQSQLSTPILHFRPGRSPQSFDVLVSNRSNQFATFQLELIASGVSTQADASWYSLAPDLSAKIPPGDRTQFTVTILDVPPIPGGFVGTMTLAVRIFSPDLRDEDRQVLNLVIEGSGVQPPRLNLTTDQFSVNPNTSVEIPIRLLNPNRSVVTVDLSLRGLPFEWLPDGNERRLQISPMDETAVVFLCQIPTPMEAPSQTYFFEFEARVTSSIQSRASGKLTVLPAGQIEFTVTPPEQRFPVAKRKATPGKQEEPREQTQDQDLEQKKDQTTQPALWKIQFDNQSNVAQELTIIAVRQRRRIFWFADEDEQDAGGQTGAQPDKGEFFKNLRTDRVVIIPETKHLEVGGLAAVEMQLGVKRPLLGWVRHQRFQVRPKLSDDRIVLHPPTRMISLHVIPQIRVWLQLLAFGVLALFIILPLLWRTSHRGPVNSVQFDGLANQVVSGSDDQTVRRWAVGRREVRPIDRPADADKAVRVVRYRPLNNNVVAIGFENGEIRLVNLLDDSQRTTMLFREDDRVFDLEFSPDSRSLFSAHGSGLVLRWDVLNPASTISQPEQQEDVGFALQDLAMVGVETPHLAIAGRFNRLLLWNWQTNSFIPVNYEPGDQIDYITSIDSAEQHPNLLAVGDNQGLISLWDLTSCLEQGDDCRQLDGWSDGHDGRPVQAVALSDDACYLASGGDDGTVMLWSLGSDGRVSEGQQLADADQPINSVDVILRENRVLVVSGGSDRHVRIFNVRNTNRCQGN